MVNRIRRQFGLFQFLNRGNDMRMIESRNTNVYGLFDKLVAYAASRLAELKRIRRVKQSRAVTQQLLTQDDRILDDMGVSRADVEQALAVAWDVDPAAELAEIRRRRMQAARQGLIQHRVR